MSADDSILAAYALTAVLVAGLSLATFVRAQRVKKALAAQERANRA